MAIEYKRSIKFTRDSTIYGHAGLDEAGFPVGAGNGKLSQVLDMAEVQTIENLKAGITITNDPDNSLLYHLNIGGVSVATFEVPPDKFLKSVQFNESTKILSFVFVTESGTESTIPVNLSSLIDTYKAGNGLLLSSGYFSIKLKSGETRLVVSSDGLSFDASDIIERIDAETQRATNAETGLANRMTSVETEFSNLSDDLEAKAVRAESAATNASNSATTATQQATVATEKASQAGNSASRASASEANASTYAGNAQASANTAKSYAEQAQTLLEEAELNVITSIEQTVTSTEPSGKNTVTITQKNGTVSKFDIYNGAQGPQGEQGVQGPKGDAGPQGEIGPQGTPGDDKVYVGSTAPTDSKYQVWVNPSGTATTLASLVYPVGSIYMSVSDTDPSILFGGTWVSIASGRVLMGVDASHGAGSTEESGLPNITGQIKRVISDYASAYGGALYQAGNDSTGFSGGSYKWGNLAFDASKSNSIYGKSTTVQPPAFYVYMWRRTA